ncbi:MAG: GNAT family N-acetyltransferase [Nitratireductor sp.]
MSSIEVKVFEGLEAIEEFSDQWSQLAENTVSPLSVFQTPQWCLTWLATKEDAKPVFVTCWENEALVMLLPLMETKRMGTSVLEFLTIPDCEYCEPLFAEKANKSQVLGEAFAYLKKHKQFDVCRFRNVPELAHDYAAKLSATNRVGDLEYSSVYNFQSYSNFEDYMAQRSKSARKSIRKKYNKLETLGDVKVEVFEMSQDYINRNFKKFSEWKIEWLQQNGLVGGNFAPDELRAHISKLVNLKDAGFKMMGAHVVVDGVPQICHLMIEYKGTSFGYLAFRNLELDAYGLGEVLDMETIKYGFENDLKYMDLMGGPSAYKDKLCNERITLYDYNYSFSLRGQMYILYNLIRVRETLKAAFYRLPMPIRRAFLWIKKKRLLKPLGVFLIPATLLWEIM